MFALRAHSTHSPHHRIRWGHAAAVLAALILVGCGRSGGGPSVAGESVSSTTDTTTTTIATTTTTTQQTYVVQSGDSLSVIANRFGVDTKTLADFNAISDPNSIQVGQSLAIPPTTLATTESEPISEP